MFRKLGIVVDELLGMNAEIGVLDYALGRLLRVQVIEVLSPRTRRPASPAPKLHDLRVEAQTLFAVIAQVGHTNEHDARSAFDAGMRRLLPMAPPEFSRPSDWLNSHDRALTRFDQLPPAIKQALIEALVLTVAHDRQVTLGEAELLRVVCASLHCPLPPLVADAAA